MITHRTRPNFHPHALAVAMLAGAALTACRVNVQQDADGNAMGAERSNEGAAAAAASSPATAGREAVTAGRSVAAAGKAAAGSAATAKAGEASPSSRESATLDLCALEAPANDSPETAASVEIGVPTPACIGADGDVDYYLLHVPTEDLAGGFFSVSVTNVGESGLAQLQAYLDADNSKLLVNVYGEQRGNPTFGYWASAPGQTYRLSVAQFSNWVRPWSYTLQVSYTPIADSNEPNDTRDQAKPIELGVEVEGHVFAGFRAGGVKPEHFEDWFELDLMPGTVTLNVKSFPRDAIAHLGMIDPMGVAIRPGPTPYAANRGADLMASATVTQAGKHKLWLGVFSTPPSSAGKAESADGVPDSFQRAYKLRATQP